MFSNLIRNYRRKFRAVKLANGGLKNLNIFTKGANIFDHDCIYSDV